MTCRPADANAGCYAATGRKESWWNQTGARWNRFRTFLRAVHSMQSEFSPLDED